MTQQHTNRRRAAVGATSAALALAVAGGAVAQAAPPVAPTPQGSPPVAPTPQYTPPTAPTPIPQYNDPGTYGPGAIPDPPTNQGWRPNPQGGGGNYAPIYYAPTPSAPMAVDPLPFLPPARPMIIPEPGVIRLGTEVYDKPTWMTVAEMNSINRWAAYIESQIARAWIAAGYSEDEADRRAATSIVGAGLGTVAGFGTGFALGFVPGSIIGGLGGLAVGTGVGAITALVVTCGPAIILCMVQPATWVVALGLGAAIGGPLGMAGGALAGGTVTGLALAIPFGLAGFALGSIFGGGDPNQQIRPWEARDGKGVITPLPEREQFHWEGGNLVPGGITVTVHEDDTEGGTWAVEIGPERWLGASSAQRDKYFYGEMEKYGQPGKAVADTVRGVLEDPKGPFQQTLRDFFAGQAKENPNDSHWNGKGALPDGVVPKNVPLGSTPTPPTTWKEPNRDSPEVQQQQQSAPDAGVLPALPDDANTAPAGNAPAATPAVAQAPVQAAPVQRHADPVQQAVADVKATARNLVPGLAHLPELQ